MMEIERTCRSRKLNAVAKKAIPTISQGIQCRFLFILVNALSLICDKSNQEKLICKYWSIFFIFLREENSPGTCSDVSGFTDSKVFNGL